MDRRDPGPGELDLAGGGPARQDQDAADPPEFGPGRPLDGREQGVLGERGPVVAREGQGVDPAGGAGGRAVEGAPGPDQVAAGQDARGRVDPSPGAGASGQWVPPRVIRSVQKTRPPITWK